MATKKERQRKLARDAYARRATRQAARQQQLRKWSAAAIVAVIVAAVGVGSAVAAGAFSTKPSKPTAGVSSSPSASASASASPSATPSPTPTSAMVAGKCIYTKSGTAARKVSEPPAKPDLKATYRASMATNRGTIVIDLANSGAPCTVGSLVSLADQHFFNNTQCHRLVTTGIFVLQCGDPTGTGRGGPGYQFYTENTKSLKLTKCPASFGTNSMCGIYAAGTVAMANSESPDTNGSQFFLVYKKTLLPANYTPFGTIVSGLNIIQNVAMAGSDNSNGQGDGHPKEKVEINSVTIKKT